MVKPRMERRCHALLASNYCILVSNEPIVCCRALYDWLVVHRTIIQLQWFIHVLRIALCVVCALLPCWPDNLAIFAVVAKCKRGVLACDAAAGWMFSGTGWQTHLRDSLAMKAVFQQSQSLEQNCTRRTIRESINFLGVSKDDSYDISSIDTDGGLFF